MSAGQLVHIKRMGMVKGSCGWKDVNVIECRRGEDHLAALERSLKSNEIKPQWMVDMMKADRIRVFAGNKRLSARDIRYRMPWLPKPTPVQKAAEPSIAPFVSSRTPPGAGWMGEGNDERREPQMSITSEYHSHVAEPVLPGPDSSAPIDGPDED